jgi:hypothetical protein
MIAHVHADLFVEETMMENTETTPTPVAANITPIKLQFTTQMYPLLSGIYGGKFYPFNHEIQESICALLSEIVHLLDASQEGLKVKDFVGHKVSFV